ncbi:MAG: hypothetical protein JRN52_05500 [Nitrososphaerota archaeon]|nr:hypothetical protein [Nitrososphaerota archaeon]
MTNRENPTDHGNVALIIFELRKRQARFAAKIELDSEIRRNKKKRTLIGQVTVSDLGLFFLYQLVQSFSRELVAL